jgi:hypothetical protein
MPVWLTKVHVAYCAPLTVEPVNQYALLLSAEFLSPDITLKKDHSA